MAGLRDQTCQVLQDILRLNERQEISVVTWFTNGRPWTDTELSVEIGGAEDDETDAVFSIDGLGAIQINPLPGRIFVGYPTGTPVSRVLGIAAIIAAARLGGGRVEDSDDLWPDAEHSDSRDGFEPDALAAHLKLDRPESSLEDAARRLLSKTHASAPEDPNARS